jgi:hypothetical protein
MTLRWFATQGTRGLYVVEYVSAARPFDIWIKWARGFWEFRLRGIPAGLLTTYEEPGGQRYYVQDGNVPQKDLDKLRRGVVEGWHAAPPEEFFAVRFPAS